MKLLIINGPNLNLLGKREPGVYGVASAESIFEGLKNDYPDVDFEYFQSNIEGELVDAIQRADGLFDGVVLNAGGYTHTSVAILDALKATQIKTVEVHISNVMEREEYRKISYVREYAFKTISGEGLNGYLKAIDLLV